MVGGLELWRVVGRSVALLSRSRPSAFSPHFPLRFSKEVPAVCRTVGHLLCTIRVGLTQALEKCHPPICQFQTRKSRGDISAIGRHFGAPACQSIADHPPRDFRVRTKLRIICF